MIDSFLQGFEGLSLPSSRQQVVAAAGRLNL